MKKIIMLIMFLLLSSLCLLSGAFAISTMDNTAYWALENLTDESSNGYDLLNTGGATYTASGKINGAYDFDGTNDYIDADSLVLDTTSDYSLSVWVNTDDKTKLAQYLYLQKDGSAVLRQNGGNFEFSIYDGTSYTIDYTIPSNSVWYHLVATRSKTNGMKLYVNGVLRDSNAYVGDGVDNNRKNSIGSAYAGSPSQYFNGKLDEFSIWNKALTSTEIQELYNSGTGYNPYAISGTTPTIVSNETTGNWFNYHPTLILNTTSNSNYSYIQNGGNKTSIGNNINTTSFSPTLSYGENNFIFISNDENGETNSSYTYYYDNVLPVINDNVPIVLNNATIEISQLYNYTEDNVVENSNANIFRLYENATSYTDYWYNQSLNIIEFRSYDYSIIITDEAGNQNSSSGSFLFDILASIYIYDEDYNLSVENTELNITGSNFSDYSYSNPYQEWISNLGDTINYSYTDSSGETIDKTGSINFSTTQTDYYIYVENTPFKMYFYDVTNSTSATNFLILDGDGDIEYNESSISAVYIQKDFAQGLVRVIFNWNTTGIYGQQYQYINDLTQSINENVLILPDMNSVGFFKVTDIYGVELEDVTIKLQARHQNETTPLLTTNQVLTSSEGNANMYYELGNGYYYWVSVNKDNYVAQQFQIDLDNIENGDSSTPYTIRLEKSGTTMNNGLSAYFNTEYNNETSQIPMYFYTTKYSTIKFKTQYMIDRGIDWITIPENSNLDNVYAYTLAQFVDYSGSGEDITLYVQADTQSFTYNINYNGDTKEIFSDLRNTNNEYLPFIIFIALIMIIVGVRYQFKDDSMSVPIYFIGIILMSLVTQTALYGFIPLMLIGIYYLSKSFKKVGENTE